MVVLFVDGAACMWDSRRAVCVITASVVDNHCFLSSFSLYPKFVAPRTVHTRGNHGKRDGQQYYALQGGSRHSSRAVPWAQSTCYPLATKRHALDSPCLSVSPYRFTFRNGIDTPT